jgi:hypothetical protein
MPDVLKMQAVRSTVDDGNYCAQEFVFKKHIQQAHSLSPEEYTNNYGSPAVQLKLHNCKVTRQRFASCVGLF